jgi:hypothetical protein
MTSILNQEPLSEKEGPNMSYLTMLFIVFTIIWVIHAEVKPNCRIRIWKRKEEMSQGGNF